MKTPGYEILEEDLIESLLAGSPLTAVEFATSIAEDLIKVMAEGGWLVEPHQCEYGNLAKTVDSENNTRPGSAWCVEHSA